MKRVALTGGIATGKTYVRARVEARGIPTIDSDRIVHDLLARGTAVSAVIAQRFGPSVLLPDGAVNRPSLGRRVFADAAARADLERIIHPRVYERIFRWAEEQQRRGAPWVMADIPLLFETGMQREFDRVIVTACEPDVQVARLVARDGLTEAEARARLAAQWPIAEKVQLADYVIRTDGRFEDTDRQVDEVVSELGGVGEGTEN